MSEQSGNASTPNCAIIKLVEGTTLISKKTEELEKKIHEIDAHIKIIRNITTTSKYTWGVISILAIALTYLGYQRLGTFLKAEATEATQEKINYWVNNNFEKLFRQKLDEEDVVEEMYNSIIDIKDYERQSRAYLSKINDTHEKAKESFRRIQNTAPLKLSKYKMKINYFAAATDEEVTFDDENAERDCQIPRNYDGSVDLIFRDILQIKAVIILPVSDLLRHNMICDQLEAVVDNDSTVKLLVKCATNSVNQPESACRYQVLVFHNMD